MFHDTKINLFALLVLLVGSIVFFENYKDLENSLKNRGVLVEDIKNGLSNFHVIQDNKCVGNLSFESLEKQMLGLQVSLAARLNIANKIQEAEMRGAFYFNAIGQLVGGQSRLNVGEEYLSTEFRGVNPIRMRVVGVIDKKEIIKQIDVPGYIELAAANDFSLLYPKLLEVDTSGLVSQIEDMHLDIRKGPCDKMGVMNLRRLQ